MGKQKQGQITILNNHNDPVTVTNEKNLTFTSLLIVLTNQPNKQTHTQKARIKIEDTHHRNRNQKELRNT